MIIAHSERYGRFPIDRFMSKQDIIMNMVTKIPCFAFTYSAFFRKRQSDFVFWKVWRWNYALWYLILIPTALFVQQFIFNSKTPWLPFNLWVESFHGRRFPSQKASNAIISQYHCFHRDTVKHDITPMSNAHITTHYNQRCLKPLPFFNFS